ncbi:MAG TPA: CHAT domain-containing protein [Kofleriaceae bacterium]
MTIVRAHSGDVQAYFSTYHRASAAPLTRTSAIAGAIGRAIWSVDWPTPRTRALLLEAPSSARLSPRRSRPRRTRSPWTSENRHLVLFLAANSKDITRLALDEECAAIEHELRLSPGRDELEFRSKWALSVDEMMRHLNESQPTIVHFSGHGSPDNCARSDGGLHRELEVAGCAGIHLQDKHRSQYVTGRALAQMIASTAPSTRVVVLNACFSDALAGSLLSVVECVVGMTGAIADETARSFAVSFYRALGNRRSIGNAVAQAVATLAAKQLPDERLPVCRTRDGVRADQIFLPSLNH